MQNVRHREIWTSVMDAVDGLSSSRNRLLNDRINVPTSIPSRWMARLTEKDHKLVLKPDITSARQKVFSWTGHSTNE